MWGITYGNGMGIIVIDNGEYHEYMMGISISYMEYGDMVIYPLVKVYVKRSGKIHLCLYGKTHVIKQLGHGFKFANSSSFSGWVEFDFRDSCG